QQKKGSIEVPSSVVGDHLKVILQKKRRKNFIANLEEVLLPSPDRRAPLCSHVRECGGCTWQQVAYAAQIKEKEKKIKGLFSYAGEEPLFHPIVTCSSPWEYRNKMEYTFSEDKQGKKFLGLVIPFSKGRVFNLNECKITRPWFAEGVTSARAWWEKSQLLAFHPPSNRGTLRTLTLREGMATGSKMAVLTISGNLDYFITKTHLTSFTKAMQEVLGEEGSIFLRIHRAEKGKPSDFYEMHLAGPPYLHEKLSVKGKTFSFSLSPSSFFQPNTFQAEKLFTRALEMAQPTSEMILYDLFSGTATLGMVFAPFVKQVFSVEQNPYAICDATINLEENQISNLLPIQQDVLTFLSSDYPRTHPPDLILLDPPRSGLHPKALSLLAYLKAKKILYISCGPETQQEDCCYLLSQGYTLAEVQPVDQFPHTPHIENIVLLKRREEL
ncbi:MAG: 23S rRNA (uracil(1939)-C(5))-methyltransferase RlmD, partial [Chlamydiales bacterium]|nr:23S rRNA (uracil(1939)-C(5))-methyltransferase RlmD [Chlamydiales bacterium]